MFIWIAWISLPWWAAILWVLYLIYFIVRACNIWYYTNEYGLIKGYKYVFFGDDPKDIRLYHLMRILFDVPPAIIGLSFPFVKAVFKMKVYTFKKPIKKEGKLNETA